MSITPSSTSQITILLDESKVEELTGWLTVNNREIIRVHGQTTWTKRGRFEFDRKNASFFTRSEDYCTPKKKTYTKVIIMIFSEHFWLSFIAFDE